MLHALPVAARQGGPLVRLALRITKLGTPGYGRPDRNASHSPVGPGHRAAQRSPHSVCAKQPAPLPATATQQLASTVDKPPAMRLVLVAAVALLDSHHRVLLAQRPKGKEMAGLWEFPGGKVEEGETPEAALVRELQEELCIEVDEASLQPLTFASHTYSKASGKSFHLLMPVYACRSWSGELVGAEGQAFMWVGLEDLECYEMPPADIPLLPAIRAAMQGLLPSCP